MTAAMGIIFICKECLTTHTYDLKGYFSAAFSALRWGSHSQAPVSAERQKQVTVAGDHHPGSQYVSGAGTASSSAPITVVGVWWEQVGVRTSPRAQGDS